MRQEIQGLRAVAVLLVVLFHLWPHRVPGGYVGVDVFFVISGFLITSLLVREVDRTGTVSLADFWARRIRRLLPAAYVVLLASAVAVVTLVPRTQWQQFLGEILGAGLYVENWLLALSSVDYLAADGAPSPAQHYWTLSAEEQFYFVWPLLVLVGLWWWRRRSSSKTGVFVVLSASVAASLAYSLWVTATNPAWAYFVTPARAWEFGAGALLAFAPAAARWLPAVVRGLLGWIAVVVLLACAVVLDEATPMPGTAAIWVVLAAAVLIWVEAPRLPWSSDRLLVLRPARALGDISYAVYLWHWPLIILLPYATEHPLTTLDKVSVVMATVALSALTKRFVEDPVRAGRHLRLARPRITFGYAAVGALLLTTACVVPRHDVVRQVERDQQLAADLVAQPPDCFGAAARDPKSRECPNAALASTIVPTPEAAREDSPSGPSCKLTLGSDPGKNCRFGTPREGVPHVAVIGDSHAGVLMTAVARLVRGGKLTADKFTASACPWSTEPQGPQMPYAPACNDFRSKLYPYLDDHATDYDAIITTARLTLLSGSHAEQVRGMSEAWSRVTRQGVPVVVVRDNPTASVGTPSPQSCLVDVAPARANQECALDRGERLDRWFDALSVAASRTPGAHVVDLTDFYCDEDSCPVVVGGVNVYRDNNHLTATYARTLAPFLLRKIRAIGILSG